MNIKKVLRIIVPITLVAVTLWVLYITISTGTINRDLTRNLAFAVFLGCEIMLNLFSEETVWEPPAEIKEDEDYILALDRVKIGQKFISAGGMMFIIPFIIILILQHASGILAGLLVFAILAGILSFLFGLILDFAGERYLTKVAMEYNTEEELMAESGADSEEKEINKAIIVIRIVSLIALIGWGISMFISIFLE
ncbi:MAG: hypothetical protein PUB87_04720 [Eubacteriaceae bacterium]|nr:hypothetical protein [Eubacteriaceae bacterium]